MGMDFVSLGEVMIQLNPLTPGPLRTVTLFERHVAGAEVNVMIGLTRLGYKTGFITRVGKDEFGILIVNTLRSEGVDVSCVKVDEEAPTGIYFVQRHYPVPGKSTVFYYRKGSAASRISEEDIDEEYVKNFSFLYLTGITPALSESCNRAVNKIYGLAMKYGLKTVFDTNIRLKLWESGVRAAKTIEPYLRSDIVFSNVEDLGVLFPGFSVNEAVQKILDKGAEVVVVKLGEKGACAFTKFKKAEAPAFKTPVVEDVIGAGDAFNSAFLASYLKGFPLEECLRLGNAAGALVVCVRGDIEALPRWEDLEVFLESKKRNMLLR
ncbi:MAG: sugar kinase [Thermoprotei archaeon]|nr:MAG: sugar kinase [Thermoprotei archaeon]